MKDIFRINRSPYSVKQNFQFSTPRINTESILNHGPKIWDMVPSSLKELYHLQIFKKVIKQLKHEDCRCRLSKVFVQNVGFLEENNLKEVVT